MNEERDNPSTCKDSARGQAAMEKNESKTEQGCYRIEKLNGLCMPVDAKYTSFKAAVICSVFQIKEEKKKKRPRKQNRRLGEPFWFPRHLGFLGIVYRTKPEKKSRLLTSQILVYN